MDGIDHGFGFTLQPVGDDGSATQWQDLELAAGADTDLEPRQLAARLAARADRDDVARQLARALPGLVQQSVTAGGTARERATEFVAALDPTLLGAALRNADVGERRKLMRELLPVLAPPALLAVALGMADAHSQTVSTPLRTLLAKLAREAESLPGAQRPAADAAFRSLVDDMTAWWFSRTITAGGTNFEDIVQPGGERPGPATAAEPERVIQMSMETGALGNAVWSALAEMSDDAGTRRLIDIIKKAPHGNKAAGMITAQIASPTRLTMLLREEEVDFEAVDAMAHHMGMNAAAPMLDELIESKSRATRKGLLDRLVKYGPQLGPLIATHLKDPRWFVVRNMISLLRDANCSLDLVPIDAFAQHTDGRVRREAYQLLFNRPVGGDAALITALKDSDRNVVRAALQHARQRLPDAAVATLAQRVVDGNYPPEFRVITLHLLARSNSILALEALLAWCTGGKSLLGKPKLAPKSPEMLAALSGLARNWRHERRAAPLLEMAAHSKDEQIVNIATGRVGLEEDK